MRIACCVSHSSGSSLWACLGAIAKLKGAELDPVRVIIGKRSMTDSMNAALDIAFRADAELLLHLESDVLLTPQAVERMLEAYVAAETYLVLGSSYNPLLDRLEADRVRLLDMGIIRDRFRLGNEATPYQDFCADVEKETGLRQVVSPNDNAVAYWHPVWTGEELHAQFCQVYPQLEDEALQARMESFLTRGLQLDPSNRALLAGKAALQSVLVDAGRQDNVRFRDYNYCAKQLDLDGTEYYVRHKFYASLAKSTLDSDLQAVCDQPESHVPLIHWR
jgi:hypothetical protein